MMCDSVTCDLGRQVREDLPATVAYRSRPSCYRSPDTPVLEAAAMKRGKVGEGMVSTW